MKIENFQSQVCVCAASTNLTCAKGRAEMRLNMNVYYNGDIRNHGRKGTRLAEFPLNRTFLWDGQEVFIPAIYLGPEGAVLDTCAKIPTRDMAAFLKKWDKARRQSLQTMEDYEQIDADNPGSRNYALDAALDDTPLICQSYSSVNWYPREVFSMTEASPARSEEWENDMNAEILMDAYGCHRKCCWHLARHLYKWSDIPLLSPRKISLTFRADLIPITAGHFTTCAEDRNSGLFRVTPEYTDGSVSCSGRTIQTIHPVTGEKYTLTLHEFELNRHDFTDIGAKNVIYPESCRSLSYRISPEISRELFDIRDCGEGDHPKSALNASGAPDGACAVFMAMKSPVPQMRMASSNMHFEPLQEVLWRMVFQVKPKPDTTVTFQF